MKCSSAGGKLVLVLALTAVFPYAFGCRKDPGKPSATEQRKVPAPAGAQAPVTTDASGKPTEAMFELSAHPGATVITPLDPHKLSQTELQFGIAPKRSADVEYQKDVILMEEGDKAIRSVASDGLTWKFDANAPHVSEFAEDKIVFATGRAVGRILSLKREGDTVSTILGPVQLTDLIENGKFAMDQSIDPENMLSYVAPDFPQPQDTAPDQKASQLDDFRDQPSDGIERTLVVSKVSKDGTWTPTSVAQTYTDGRRVTYRKQNSQWSTPQVSLANLSPFISGSARIGLALQQVTPGMPQVPKMPQIPIENLSPAVTTGPPPVVNIQDVKVTGIANKSGVGLQYVFSKNGLNVNAYGMMNLNNTGVRFVLDIQKAKIVACGVKLSGGAGVRLHLNSSSTQEFNVNAHIKHTLPIDFSIPLGGPVPFSLTFNTAFNVDTAFSAKTSILNAEGNYGFSGGVWAGYQNGSWSATAPANITATTDLGKTAEGISVGINSLAMAFSVRALVGVGAFGFNTGIYVGLRFGGTVLMAPTIGWACRQGTINTYIDSGVGYSIPHWVTDAINFFLSPFTKKRIDSAGTVLRGPSFELFHGNTQVPGGCATPKQSGG